MGLHSNRWNVVTDMTHRGVFPYYPIRNVFLGLNLQNGFMRPSDHGVDDSYLEDVSTFEFVD
jgi:hypothetical protein